MLPNWFLFVVTAAIIVLPAAFLVQAGSMVAMFLTVRRIQAKIQEVNAQVQGLMLDGRAVAIGARRIALDARTNGRLLFSGVRAQAGRVDSLLTETKERARLRFSRRAAGLMARPERDAA